MTDKIMSEEIWGKSVGIIKERLNSQAFNTWFKPITNASVSDNLFVLQVPNKFFEGWIRDN